MSIPELQVTHRSGARLRSASHAAPSSSQRNMSSSSGRMMSRAVCGLSSCGKSTHQRDGRFFGGFAHHERRGGGDRIGAVDQRDLHFAPIDVVQPRRSSSTAMPALPIAPPIEPSRHGRFMLSLTMTPGRTPVCARDRVADPARRRVGILRQQQRVLVAIVLDVRLIDAGLRADEPEPMPHDQHAGFLAQHGGRFAQDQFDEARIFFGFLRELDRFAAGRDRRERKLPSFGFRDDLLRDHEDVARFESQLLCRSAARIRPADRRRPAPSAFRRSA